MILVSINFTTLAYSFSSHVCGESTLCALYVHSMCKLYVHPMCTLCVVARHILELTSRMTRLPKRNSDFDLRLLCNVSLIAPHVFQYFC